MLKTNILVKQGGPASPKLYSIYSQTVIEKIKESISIKIGTVKINVIAYADDIILLTESYAGLIQLISVLCKECSKLKIEINEAKCEYIIFGGVRGTSENSIRINDKVLERVERIKYLGIWITSKLNCKDRLIFTDRLFQRKASAYQALFSLRNLGLEINDLTGRVKLTMFKTLIRSVNLYGFDCLAMCATEMEKLRRFDHVMLKQLFGLYKRSKAKIFMAAVGLNGISNQLMKLQLALVQNLYAYEFTREIMVETQKKVSGKGLARKCILSQLMKEAKLETLDIGKLRSFINNCSRLEEEGLKHLAQTRECQVIQKCLQNPSETNQRTIQSQIYINFKSSY